MLSALFGNLLKVYIDAVNTNSQRLCHQLIDQVLSLGSISKGGDAEDGGGISGTARDGSGRV